MQILLARVGVGRQACEPGFAPALEAGASVKAPCSGGVSVR
ncbi:MAG TPA: hypothetical protein VIJ17_13015 [Pseudolabrys sp.]